MSAGRHPHLCGQNYQLCVAEAEALANPPSRRLPALWVSTAAICRHGAARAEVAHRASLARSTDTICLGHHAQFLFDDFIRMCLTASAASTAACRTGIFMPCCGAQCAGSDMLVEREAAWQSGQNGGERQHEP